MNIARIEDEDEAAPESMFEDEIVRVPTQGSANTHRFDPFAPNDAPATTPAPPAITTAIPLDELYNSNHGGNNHLDAEMVDRFEDEDEPEGNPYAEKKEKSSRSVEDGPVLIPMNPDADADLLGSIAVKHASKARKDSKIKDITYRDDGDKETADLLMLDSDPKAKKPDDAADDFVDDDDNEEEEAPSGGLFSRLRSRIVAATAATTTTPADAKPSPPEADLPKAAAIGNLEVGGNSLPHPDSVRHGQTRDLLQESDSEDEDALDENGNSLPHPDEMVRMVGASGKSTEDKNLDANGNSLPHPDEMVLFGGAAGKSAGDENLDANGNSLPHPGEMPRFGRSARKSAADKNLDANGNSLPHPDELARSGGAAGRSADEDALDANGNSLPHPDTMMGVQETMLLNEALGRSSFVTDSGSDRSDSHRLRVALAETESENGSDDDYYKVATDDDDTGKGLEDNGNSLAPPSNNAPSSRWNRFLAPFSSAKKSKKDPEADADDDSGDEESFRDEEKMAPSSDKDLLDLVNNDELAFDENGNPLPTSERDLNEEGKKRKFTLHSMGKSVASAFRPNKARGQEENTRSNSNTLFADADEENIFGNNFGNRDDDDDDDFDDETDRDKLSSPSRKERLQSMVQEHKNNPRSRLICIAILAFLLFLVILIPLVTRNKNKEIVIAPANPPVVATSPPTTLPVDVQGDPDCVDEIVLTNQFGKDLEIEEWETPCYLTTQPIYFRFKRCRPASVQDWVGVYPAGSMFMDHLWKDWYDGVYLCGGQPCSGEEPPEAKWTVRPPIPDPGNYRLFLIKDSSWPFEFIKYTPSFQVVFNKAFCPVAKNPNGFVMAPPSFENEATFAPTSTYTWSGTSTFTSVGTTSSSFTGTLYPFFTGTRVPREDRFIDGDFGPDDSGDGVDESGDNILDNVADYFGDFVDGIFDGSEDGADESGDTVLDNVADAVGDFVDGIFDNSEDVDSPDVEDGDGIFDNSEGVVDESGVDNIFSEEDFVGV